VLAVVCHVVINVSRRNGDFLMGLLSISLHLAVDSSAGPHTSQLLHEFPRTLETALSFFKLDGQFFVYAVCMKCHSTYPYSRAGDCPEHCTNKSVPGLHCGAKLIDSRQRPVKTFAHYLFHNYLAGIMSLAHLENVTADFSGVHPNSTLEEGPLPQLVERDLEQIGHDTT
jgi:hypothetical protein